MKRHWIHMLFILITLLSGCTRQNRQDTPLACLSLITSNDSFSQEIASTFKDTMSSKGYRVKILYCENSIETQSRHIASFVQDGADILFVQLAGDGEDYCDILNNVRENECKVIVMSRTILDCCDVQSLGYSFLKGVAKSELVKEFIDITYPDAETASIDVVLLERLSKTGFIMTCAGMRLLSEKFIRYFSYTDLEFQRDPGSNPVYYLDEAGKKKMVEEPTGGLILDKNGYAILNPCYDHRVNLKYVSNKNITTVLDGQRAIDEYISASGGENLKIVVSFSGDAAIGANQRLLQYSREKKLNSGLSDLAVFGSDDTEVNRSLLTDSLDDKSVFRGFVGYRNVSWEVNTMLEMALSDREDKILELEITKAIISESSREPVFQSETYDFWKEFNIFRDWE